MSCKFFWEGIYYNYIKSWNEECKMVSAFDNYFTSLKDKRIAVLGDIEEAGAFSDEIHKEVIAAVDASQFDVLLLYGEKMLRAAEKVKVRDTLEVVCFTAKSPMSEAIRSKHLKTGDIVLFKSSRKSALEEVIKMTWPVTYRLKMLEYYWPIIKWRLKVILS